MNAVISLGKEMKRIVWNKRRIKNGKISKEREKIYVRNKKGEKERKNIKKKKRDEKNERIK